MANEMTGWAECMKKLTSLENEFPNQPIRRALKSAGKILANAIKGVIASDTGTEIAAVKVRAGKRKKNRLSVLVGVFNLPGKFYAGFLEYGHKSKSGKETPGQNVLKPETEAQIETIKQGFITILAEEIKKYEGK